MIKLQTKLPKDIYVACSGGVDSMAALDFLRRKHNVIVLHYNHGTGHGNYAATWMYNYCRTNNIGFILGKNDVDKPKGMSQEEHWRNVRYNFLDNYNDKPVITAHHLDDCVETWLFSSMHGTGKWIPSKRNNVLRPFRLTRKRDFELWVNLNNIPYISDDSNNDLCYNRNYIRHKMMPHVLRINPGIHKVIAKKMKEEVV